MDRNTDYLIQRRSKKKQQLRLRLGLLQIIHRPLLSLCLTPVIILIFIGVMEMNNLLYTLVNVHQILYPLWKNIINALWIIISVLLILGVLNLIGNLTARKDEGDIAEAFTPQDLRNGCPILMDKQRIRGCNVTKREFYSSIPMKRWVEKMDDIADIMNVHFVENITYGGKSDGKRIVMYTAPGRKLTSKGDLYAEEI